MALSDEARKAIKEAVDIVREDRMEKFLRSRFKGETAPPGGPTPPPKKDPTEPTPKKGLWWGELSDTGGE